MLQFETLNELTLKVVASGNDVLFTKAGAFIMGQNAGPKNYQFEKVLLGPQGNPLQAFGGQILRRFTGENLPLMRVKFNGSSVTYYANDQQHIICYRLGYGETISVESENILAFTSDCGYGVRFIAQGVISQKGLATSTLTYQGNNALVAVLTDGNPVVMSNIDDGSTMEADPDAVVCWIGDDPGIQFDVSWRNLIGQSSGESYMFQWTSAQRASVIVQPQERKSGINIGMDGGASGQRPTRQQNQMHGHVVQGIGDPSYPSGDMYGVGQQQGDMIPPFSPRGGRQRGGFF